MKELDLLKAQEIKAARELENKQKYE